VKFLIAGLITLILAIGCATNRDIKTQIDTKKYPVVDAPTEFQSPIDAIDKISSSITDSKIKDKELISIKHESLKFLIEQQTAIKNELKTTQRLELRPGYSYEFDLESFCINAGVERPVIGDGLFLGDIQSPSKNWLFQILSDYKNQEIPQNEAQVLIWSLLSGAKFDELNSENQRNLKRIFSDAPVRFGNSIVEESAKSFLLSQVPDDILMAKEKLESFRSLLQDTRANFLDIEQVLSPEPKRNKPISVGWIKHESGYFIRLKSNGYQRVKVQIYSPENIRPKTYFNPTNHVAIPGNGQRLAMSTNVLDHTNKYLGDLASKIVKKKTGQGLTESERTLFTKYPMDAYKIGNSMMFAIEKTNEIFPDISKHNTKADAFRHFIWSGMSAQSIGSADRALEFLIAHEDFPENPVLEKSMDIHNNKMGIEFYRSYNGNNFEDDLIKHGLEKVKNGELTWLP
jgi:hypothetical protein